MSVQTLAEIRTRFREDTGRSQVADLSNDAVDALIMDWYVNHFPSVCKVDEFNGCYTQALSATDTGVYSIAQNIDRLDDPVTINGDEITLYRDRELFFGRRNQDEQYITEPTLAIGSSDSAKVLHAAFNYLINGFAYSKATSEVALSGDTVPQNKYGAWSLKIDADGDITVAEADDNATGYDTPRLALEALDSSDGESAYMGYVTVISTAAAGFIPGTTALDNAAVTDTYTDGRFESRATPVSALLYGQNLYLEPKPNDIGEFKALTISDRPTALSEDTDEVDDAKWGPAIARGAAIFFLEPRGGQERIADLALTTKHIFGSIRQDKIKRLLGQEVQRTF